MTKDILYLFLSLLLFFKDFMYLSLGIGGGGERKRDRNINARDKRWPGASRIRPDQGRTHNPGMCSNWERNQRPFALQNSTQPLSHTPQDFIPSKSNYYNLCV